MLSDGIFNNTSLPVIKSTLDAAMLRSRTIANNIANVNTPGYRRVEVSFEKELREALDRNRLQGVRTNEKHLPLGKAGNPATVTPMAFKPIDPTLPSGVNNVDIDREMARLAETQIQYNYAIKFGQNVFRKLNSAIQTRSTPIQ